MALPLLGIASGAIKIGQKLFGGIKKRKQRKAEKRAAKTEAEQTKLNQFAGLFGGGGAPGTDQISASGNALLGMLAQGKGLIPTTSAPDYEEVRAERVNQMIAGAPGGIDPKMITIGVIALIAFLFFKKGR